MVLLYTYTTYTELLQNISVHYATCELILTTYVFILTLNIMMVICSYSFVNKQYNFFSYVVCRYYIFSCPTTHILITQHFCYTTRVNISTGVTVPVTVTESTVHSDALCYTCTLAMGAPPPSPPLFKE